MKNRRNRWIPIILLVVIIGIAVTSCGSSSPLVGKWEHTQDEGYIEFFSDGKAEMGYGFIVYSCTYEETGNKEITLTLVSVNGEAADEDPIVLEYSFSGDELTLDDGENPETFRRVD